MSWFDLFTFEKLYSLKKGPIFVGSYAIQNKLIQKSICSHQLFRQIWAFPRLSTPVLHKCGHTIHHTKIMYIFYWSRKTHEIFAILKIALWKELKPSERFKSFLICRSLGTLHSKSSQEICQTTIFNHHFWKSNTVGLR